MKKIIYNIWAIAVLGLALAMNSCTGDLNTSPISDNELTGKELYGKELGSYTSALAKVYAGYAISGNKGGDDQQDVEGVDGGSQASFLRGLWNLQQLPTDEAHCNWNDVGIDHFNYMRWDAGNVFIKGFYYRLYYQINLVNEFLRETEPGKLDGRGVEANTKAEIQTYREEARFLRAMAYYYLLDMFRNVPFVDESSPIGKYQPEQIQAADLFDYVEKELLECKDGMLDSFVGYHSKYYGRAHKAAAWSLLSRLYLNAETYTGTAKYTESVTYSKLVIDAGYTLDTNYKRLFSADNDRSPEMIYPIRYEGDKTQTWGGMTFLICSTVPSDMQKLINAQGAWQGNRAKKALIETFRKTPTVNVDKRFSLMHPELADNEEILDPTRFKDGVPVVKYVNTNSDGTLPASTFAYTDFPVFRLGEIYLNYAEAILRGGAGGSRADALAKINELRIRSCGNVAGATINDNQLTLNYLLDERSRELFFEAQRRTDLVRYNLLTTPTYIWDWKGGVFIGQAVNKRFNIYPIPADDMGSNSNLEQNEGYN